MENEISREELIKFAKDNLNDPEVFYILLENEFKRGGIDLAEFNFFKGLVLDNKADFYLFRFNEGPIALTLDDNGITKPYLLFNETQGNEFIKENHLESMGKLEHHIMTKAEFGGLLDTVRKITMEA